MLFIERNGLFIHKEISKLSIPQVPINIGYWDGTSWRTHKPKKKVTIEWTGVGNLNPNKHLTTQKQTKTPLGMDRIE